MAHYDKSLEDLSASQVVQIKNTENLENYTVYVISMKIGHITWIVRHRYSEFYELHEKLVNEFKISKSLLPPKKYFGKTSQEFVKKRQHDLEVYLRTLLRHFMKIPHHLAAFLNFYQYEIHGISQKLAEELYHKGDGILSSEEIFNTTPLQLYSICQRLKLAEPTCDSGDVKDIGHVLDFIHNLTRLRIEGGAHGVGDSNIIPNQLPFDMTHFKSLNVLKLDFCDPTKISGVENMKKTLLKLSCHRSLKAIKEILLVDMGFGQWLGCANEAVLVPAWHNVITADFSHNQITYIDESIKLLPSVRHLDLSHNRLQVVQELQHLPLLTHVDLSSNNLKQLMALHTKFGNIKHLNLSCNHIDSLQGLAKLYSLELLNVSHNEILSVNEVDYLSTLPCLENLDLRGNPVTSIVDYRACVLELFLDRAKEITLDGEVTSSHEFGTIAVRVALLKARRAQEKKQKLSTREASISQTPANETQAVSESATTSVTNQLDLSCSPAVEATSILHKEDNSLAEMEALRERGGDDWLSLLNKEKKEGEEQNEKVKKKKKEHVHKYRYHYEDRKMSDNKNCAKAGEQTTTSTGSKQTDESECNSSDSTSSDATTQPKKIPAPQQQSNPTSQQQGMYSEVDFVLPESMPSRNDANFVAHLQVMTPDTLAIGRRSGDSHREERPVYLMWAPAISYVNPYMEFPTCVYISTENIHIYQVKALTSGFEIPDMRHLYCIPLMSVQQIVLGYGNLSIRVEEAFVGPQGTFTFLTGSAAKTDLFVDSLKLAYRRAVADLDQYEDPHIIVNEECETSLKELLSGKESVPVNDLCIELYMLVHTIDCDDPTRTYSTHSLVITSKYMYLLRENYVLWPQPTFSVAVPSRPLFQIIKAYPLTFRTSSFTMYDSDTHNSPSDPVLAETFSATNTSAMLTPNFIGYGVTIGFENEPDVLDIRVPTPSLRSRFLEALTRARERLTSPRKARLQVQDGDESAGSTGSSPVHGKHIHRVKKKSHTSSHSPKLPKGSLHKALAASNADTHTSESDNASSEPVYRGARPKVLKPEVTETGTDTGHKTVSTRVTHPSTDSSMVNSDQSRSDRSISRDSPIPEMVNPVSQHSISVDKDNSDKASLDIYIDARDDTEKGYLASAQASSIESGNSNDLLSSADVTFNRPSTVKVPTSLNISYPSLQLLNHLSRCNEDIMLLQPLSDDLQHFASMSGDEILNFFHGSLSQIGVHNEELRHILWVETVPYVNPRQIIHTCLMLSTKAIYFVSDDAPKAPVLKSPWKKHMRNHSDMTSFIKGLGHQQRDVTSKVGILQRTIPRKNTLKVFAVLALEELKTVDVGLFDQSFRLACDNENQVLCCLTRDALVTESFLRQLMSVLSLIPVLSSPEMGASGNEQDFYKMFYGGNYYRSQSYEYVHPSKVRFVYPQDDVINDVVYLFLENVSGKKPENASILMYVLCYFQLKTAPSGGQEINITQCVSRTVNLTEKHVTLLAEDCVSYPLPQFAKQPPIHKQHEVLQIRSLEYLKRVEVSDFKSRDLTLIFSDECEEIKVDVSLDYYSPRSGRVARRRENLPGEVTWTLVLQCMRDKDKMIQLLARQWAEINGGQLSVQVST